MRSILLFLGFLVATLGAPGPHESQVGTIGLPGKIVGGKDAQAGELPYQLSLQTNGKHFCGASIVNEFTAVTAAHCVYKNSRKFTIVAGELDLKKPEGNEQVSPVEKIIIHEGYSSNNQENDIAMLHLEKKLEYNDFVQPIPLQPAGPSPTGDATVSGWGTKMEGGTVANILQKVDVPIITDGRCKASYPFMSIKESMICAGFVQGGKDSCQGDSGGPLAFNQTLIGIVSFGMGCARPFLPGVYTEVAYFNEWIEQNSKQS